MEGLPIIAANWKAYPLAADAIQFIHHLRGRLEEVGGAEVIICPPLPLLSLLFDEIHPLPAHISFGAQDIAENKEPSRTGDSRAELLKAWCRYAIVGHSERRLHHNETDETVRNKADQAQIFSLKPIICVGERAQSVDAPERVAEQLRRSIGDLDDDYIVAYEPVWAIGASQPATPEQARRVLEALKPVLPPKTAVLYGGAADAVTIGGFLEVGFSGVLLGRASLQLQSLLDVIKAAREFA